MSIHQYLALVEAEAEAGQAARDAGFTIDAYHGTTADFDAFDPRLTGDIGLHFGTIDQANRAAQNAWNGAYDEGANVIPVKLRLHKVLRVRDLFSTLKTTFINRAKTWTLDTPGFHVSSDERSEIYDAAKAADAARRKAGGDWGRLDPKLAVKQPSMEAASRRFWQAIEASCRRQGYDGLIYTNRVEGKGDSYVVFDPKNVRSRHARFDLAKDGSDKLMDARLPPF